MRNQQDRTNPTPPAGGTDAQAPRRDGEARTGPHPPPQISGPGPGPTPAASDRGRGRDAGEPTDHGPQASPDRPGRTGGPDDDVMAAMIQELGRRQEGEPTEDELEAIADMLLRIYGPAEDYPVGAAERSWGEERRGFPLHSLDDASDHRSRQAHKQPAPPPEAAPAALQALVARLLVAANLTPRRRRQVARLHLWGYQLTEVAELLGLPTTTVYTQWRYARKALQEAIGAKRVDEMSAEGVPPELVTDADAREVLRIEQNRCIYIRPRHCAPGHEKCRATGVCRYAGPRYSP